MSSPDRDEQQEELDIDPIWTTSRTARQIYALGEVEKDITRLLSLAGSSISLLTLPQTDESNDNLPQGEERSEQFVLEVSEYFERLDSIQSAIRSSLAHIRHARIAPSAIIAPDQGFAPPSLGIGLPQLQQHDSALGLQEQRTQRDAWQGILDALTRLKAAQENGTEGPNAASSAAGTGMEEEGQVRMEE